MNPGKKIACSQRVFLFAKSRQCEIIFRQSKTEVEKRIIKKENKQNEIRVKMCSIFVVVLEGDEVSRCISNFSFLPIYTKGAIMLALTTNDTIYYSRIPMQIFVVLHYCYLTFNFNNCSYDSPTLLKM